MYGRVTARNDDERRDEKQNDMNDDWISTKKKENVSTLALSLSAAGRNDESRQEKEEKVL